MAVTSTVVGINCTLPEGFNTFEAVVSFVIVRQLNSKVSGVFVIRSKQKDQNIAKLLSSGKRTKIRCCIIDVSLWFLSLCPCVSKTVYLNRAEAVATLSRSTLVGALGGVYAGCRFGYRECVQYLCCVLCRSASPAYWRYYAHIRRKHDRWRHALHE